MTWIICTPDADHFFEGEGVSTPGGTSVHKWTRKIREALEFGTKSGAELQRARVSGPDGAVVMTVESAMDIVKVREVMEE